jgi:RNA polymerase sigma-70 factor, ECF subfamily
MVRRPMVRHPTDRELAAALLQKDNQVFRKLTRDLYRSMLRAAQLCCSSEAVAQEVVQETWLAVLTGRPHF